MIVFDCEIIKAIPSNKEPRIDGIAYCDGWRDFANMGISVIGCYDFLDDRYRVFCQDNFAEFQQLVDATDMVVGFNSRAFDNQLCAANNLHIDPARHYDVLIAIWNAHGLGDEFVYPTHAGFGLDACCQANNFGGKTGLGALAPVDWQRGNIGRVIDYCLNDVKLTVRLLKNILDSGVIVSPQTGDLVEVACPGNHN